MTDTTPTADTVAVSQKDYEAFLATRQAEITEFQARLTRWAARAVENGAEPAEVNKALANIGTDHRVSDTNNRYHNVRRQATVYVHSSFYGHDEAELRNSADETRNAADDELDANAFVRVPGTSDGPIEWELDNGTWVSTEEYWKTLRGGVVETADLGNDLDEMRARARTWVRYFWAKHNWCGVRNAYSDLSLGNEPKRVNRRVTVNVAGTQELLVTGFDDDTDEERMQRTTDTVVRENNHRSGTVLSLPVEPTPAA